MSEDEEDEKVVMEDKTKEIEKSLEVVSDEEMVMELESSSGSSVKEDQVFAVESSDDAVSVSSESVDETSQFSQALAEFRCRLDNEKKRIEMSPGHISSLQEVLTAEQDKLDLFSRALTAVELKDMSKTEEIMELIKSNFPQDFETRSFGRFISSLRISLQV